MSHHERPAADDPQVEALETDECWRLLQDAAVGRLAFIDADGDPEIFPVNIRVERGAVLIRSANDAKTQALVEHPRVALESDGGTLRVRWSVIAHGTAEVGPDDAPTTDQTSWYPGEKSQLIRVTVESITGKRFLIPTSARPSRVADTSR